MIKDCKELRDFENNFIKNEKVDIMKNFKIADALYKEAVALGVFPPKDPLDDIEIDIKVAKVVNSVPKATKKLKDRR